MLLSGLLVCVVLMDRRATQLLNQADSLCAASLAAATLPDQPAEWSSPAGRALVAVKTR